MAKASLTTRVDPEVLAEVRKQGLSPTKIIEEALAKAIKQKKCPKCGARR